MIEAASSANHSFPKKPLCGSILRPNGPKIVLQQNPPKSGRKSTPDGKFLHSQKLSLALPKEVEHWSLTTLREKLLTIGAKVVSHGRYVTIQMAEVAVPTDLFRKILRLIDDRRPSPGVTAPGRI